MRCKIVRFQKLMWRNMMRSTKSQKFSVLHYSIDSESILNAYSHFLQKLWVSLIKFLVGPTTSVRRGSTHLMYS